MKTSKRKLKVTLDREIKTFESNDGSNEELTNETIETSVAKFIDEMINNHNESGVKQCMRNDTIHKVYSFEIDENIIKGKYDESNKKTYNHFIHKFLRDYYSKKRTELKGGDWDDSLYEPTSFLHERLLSGELNSSEHSVRNTILQHLLSGIGGRG